MPATLVHFQKISELGVDKIKKQKATASKHFSASKSIIFCYHKP
jgi:hypothetical protein